MSKAASTQTGWTEGDTRLYRQLAPVAVPDRAEQLATLLALLPFGPDDAFQAVELGCGEGNLSAALLDCFPRASLLALDGSAAMRGRAAARLGRFGRRARVEPFNLSAADWLARIDRADCLLASLCLHHLPGPEKRRLFGALYPRLSSRGAALVADLVEPQRAEARRLFADTWDRLAQAQSVAATGSNALFNHFTGAKWNYYRFDDPADTPSPLVDQLIWLKEAGFAVVDCFWMRAGHAIYGGYKNHTPAGGVSFNAALPAVRAALLGDER